MTGLTGNRLASRGARLLWLRSQQGRSARSVALAAGVDTGLYTNLERNRKASDPALRKVAGVLGVSATYLLGSYQEYLAEWAATPAAGAAAPGAPRLQALLAHALQMYGPEALAALAAAIAVPPADLEDFLAGRRRDVPLHLAEELERHLGLPAGWIAFGDPAALREWLALVDDLRTMAMTPDQVRRAAARYRPAD